MSSIAIILVISAAFVHALWNLLAKKAGGGVVFIWLFASLSTVIYAPISVYILWMTRPQIGWLGLAFIFVSALLHLLYFFLLQRGYSKGDLSLVYPLARGTGPMLSAFAAIVFFGERPGLLAMIGAILVIISVFYLSGGAKLVEKKGDPAAGWAIRYGFFCGVVIAGYTLWDKHAVAALLIPPLILEWASSITRMLLLGPYAIKRWDEVKHQWQMNKKLAICVAVFNPLSYILVLTALVFTPVSYVAPAREISILFGTLMGTQILSEGHSKRRIVSACIMILGVIGLSFGLTFRQFHYWQRNIHRLITKAMILVIEREKSRNKISERLARNPAMLVRSQAFGLH
jgi:drug/metabolite transporter (DMT)-like permease